MTRIGRRIRAAVNPLSTAITGWWCQSAVRYLSTGYGLSAQQRRLFRLRAARRRRLFRLRAARRRRLFRLQTARGAAPSAETMQARAAAIDKLLALHDQEM